MAGSPPKVRPSRGLALVEPPIEKPFPHDYGRERLVVQLLNEHDTAAQFLQAGFKDEILYNRDLRVLAGLSLQLHQQGHVPCWHLLRAEILKRQVSLDDALLFETLTTDAVPMIRTIPLLVEQLQRLFEQRRLQSRIYAGDDPVMASTEFLAAVQALRPPAVRVLNDVEIAEQPDPDPLIPGHLWCRTTAVTAAPAGTGKTALFISKGIAIASQTPWLGSRPTIRGSVVLVAGEGTAFMKNRVLAAKLHARLDLDTPIGFYVYPDVVDFLDGAAVDRFVQRVRPLNPVLVGIDTLARNMPGGDDSSMQDISTFFSHCDRVRDALACTVEVQHHTGWNEDRERGSTALRGHVDTLFLLKKDADSVITLRTEKQKDGRQWPEQPDLRIRLTPIQLSPDQSACAVDLVDDVHEPRCDSLQDGVLDALDVLRSTFPSGATQRQWLEAMPESFVRGNADGGRRKLYRARRDLLARGLVTEQRGRVQVCHGGRVTQGASDTQSVTAQCHE